MRSTLLFAGAALAVVTMSSCTTLENRRDLYFPQTVNGPYTRMLDNGIPHVTRTIVQTTTTTSSRVSSDGKAVVAPQ